MKLTYAERLERKRLRQRLWARRARKTTAYGERQRQAARAWKARTGYRDSDTRDYSLDWKRRTLREAWRKWTRQCARSRGA